MLDLGDLIFVFSFLRKKDYFPIWVMEKYLLDSLVLFFFSIWSLLQNGKIMYKWLMFFSFLTETQAVSLVAGISEAENYLIAGKALPVVTTHVPETIRCHKY